MSKFIFTVMLLTVLAAAWVFYAKFTRKGAVPLDVAFRSFTVWLSLLGAAFGQFIVDFLAWLASIWEPLQAQFGSLLAVESAGMALQVLSGIFFLLRMKGQGFPGFKFPAIPDPTDQAGA